MMSVLRSTGSALGGKLRPPRPPVPLPPPRPPLDATLPLELAPALGVPVPFPVPAPEVVPELEALPFCDGGRGGCAELVLDDGSG